jgi:hypothetical protein
MAQKSNKMRVIMILGGIALVAALVHFSFQQTQKQYEVCVAFKGSSHCATAKGATSAEAIRSAQEIDCELLSNGRDENMVCLDSSPSSVREVK